MDLVVGIHVSGDADFGINAAKISLDDSRIKDILKMAKRARRPGEILTAYDGTPDLGTSDLDLENDQIRNLTELTEEESQQAVFGLSDEGRSELVMIYIDGKEFWWEGVFKHTDIRWETRSIPLSILPQEPKKVRAKTTTPKSDLNMTPEQMNSIHEKIARGISNGLNAREIEKTFNRHVTKAQLIRCLMELIERTHN